MMRFDPTSDARAEGVAAKGWLRAHKWWFLRRLTQITALGIFMAGPLAGVWLVRGNFASSEILGVLPLSDPLIVLQSLAAGTVPSTIALLGACIIMLFYIFVGGRAYCGWICPVNIVTDTAQWLREKLGITRDRKLDRRTRLWVLAGALLASVLSGTIAWEFVNPVSLLQRGLIFGSARVGSSLPPCFSLICWSHAGAGAAISVRSAPFTAWLARPASSALLPPDAKTAPIAAHAFRSVLSPMSLRRP